MDIIYRSCLLRWQSKLNENIRKQTQQSKIWNTVQDKCMASKKKKPASRKKGIKPAPDTKCSYLNSSP